MMKNEWLEGWENGSSSRAFPSKHEILNSNPNTAKKQSKTKSGLRYIMLRVMQYWFTLLVVQRD
jgi:hypothetical protein